MIAFRFDIDTRFGLVERTPPLLQVLADAGIRASFFCVMGREANLFELVRLRLLAPSSSKSPVDVASRGGLLKVGLAAAFPRAVGTGNPQLLRRIVADGHELAPHGWSHIQWQRNLERIDVRSHLARALRHHRRIVGRMPVGFASPGRTWNEEVLRAIDDAGLRYGGDLDGTLPVRPEGYRHLQLPVTRFETIAQMRRRGLSDEAIVDTYLADIDANPRYCCLYEHPDDLHDRELEIYRGVFAGVRERGLEPVTLAEVAERWEHEPSEAEA